MMIGANGLTAAHLRTTAQGATMPKLFRNLGAAVFAWGFTCNLSCWAQQAINKEFPLVRVLSTR
jgi:hypothetical protein